MGRGRSAARVLEPVQDRLRAGHARAHPPAAGLDRAAHLGIHQAREHPDRVAVLRPGYGQALPQPGVRAVPGAHRQHVDQRRRDLGRAQERQAEEHRRALGPPAGRQARARGSAQEGVHVMSSAAAAAAADLAREQMNVVIVGHVDHGKSTVVGRLFADTGALPQGKLDAVRKECLRTGKPFEYAFLLDALSDEQDQGITIDTARCFFKTQKRDYIIIDAPGHIEFLKNMISGAARAEAAVLIIDAKEGVRENSRRHGYILAMLGIRQVTVCVNKMDLVDHREDHFRAIEKEYRAFLEEIGSVSPRNFIPVSAIAGENLATHSASMRWYDGPTLLDTLDGLTKTPPRTDRPLRMPVQAVYKFTSHGDDRRIVA